MSNAWSDLRFGPWLAPRFPLDDASLPSGPQLALAEAPLADRFIFRGDEEARAACSASFGAELPKKLGSAGEGDDRAALWLGPDEWLLIVGGVDAEMFPVETEQALGSEPYSLVDVSHRQIGLTVSGPVSPRALSAGCPLDLHPSAFPVGMATRTIFDKAEIVLWRRDAETFQVEVWRSFALYLVAALTEAARGAPQEP
jgi:sarcosine oxidase, subunit gamma